MHVYLETERLILRRFTADDVGILVDLDSDPEVMRYLSGGPPTPREEIEGGILPAWLNYYTRFEGYGFWAAIEKVTGEFIGWFHLRPQSGHPPDQPELGYRLRRSAWGKGYGSEGSRALLAKAFTELGAERVFATTYQDNLASRRVMEKVGMRLVRTFRFDAQELETLFGVTSPEQFFEIFPGDDVEYAITKDEWSQQHG
jgi:RimJ/RimL family protein N-acetyltransferase